MLSFVLLFTDAAFPKDSQSFDLLCFMKTSTDSDGNRTFLYQTIHLYDPGEPTTQHSTKSTQTPLLTFTEAPNASRN